MRTSFRGDESESELLQDTYRGSVFNLNRSNDAGKLQFLPSKFHKRSARFAGQPQAPVLPSEMKR